MVQVNVFQIGMVHENKNKNLNGHKKCNVTHAAMIHVGVVLTWRKHDISYEELTCYSAKNCTHGNLLLAYMNYITYPYFVVPPFYTFRPTFLTFYII